MTLHEESIYLSGARDVLLRLKDDFDMSLVPLVKCKLKEEYRKKDSTEIQTSYMRLPLQNSAHRRLLGAGMYDCLINDRESLVRYLSGDFKGLYLDGVQKDKKGKIEKIKIKVL